MHPISEILTPLTAVKTCVQCGAIFELPPFVSFIMADFVKVCPGCCERQAVEDGRRALLNSKTHRAERWKQICPAEFIATNPARLPSSSQLQTVLDWKWGNIGLLLHGPTGTGKSRCAWLLLEREFKSGRTVASLNSASGVEYASRFSDGAGNVGRWMERLFNVDLLLMDDCFKSRLTDSFESALFTIINERTERQRPTIATLNDTGQTLAARLSPDRGEPMIRRLREFCREIRFGV